MEKENIYKFCMHKTIYICIYIKHYKNLKKYIYSINKKVEIEKEELVLVVLIF